jgi:hypothetical protein
MVIIVPWTKRYNCRKVNKIHGEIIGRATEVPIHGYQKTSFLVQGGYLYIWEIYLLISGRRMGSLRTLFTLAIYVVLLTQKNPYAEWPIVGQYILSLFTVMTKVLCICVFISYSTIWPSGIYPTNSAFT